VVAASVRGIVAFLYESPLLHLEVYRLLTILEASPALAEFKGTYETDRNHVRFIRDAWEETEISRIVVSLAAIIRSAVDANPGAYRVSGGEPDVALERFVGVILPDTTQPDGWQSLENFREACNKILHADRVELERKQESDALTGWLIMEGRSPGKQGKEWQVRLDLREYALGALRLTP
jgi:hypothetical protein